MSDTCPNCGDETGSGAYCIHCGVYIPTYSELYAENRRLKDALTKLVDALAPAGDEKEDSNG